MIRHSLPLVATVSVFILFADQSSAQIAFGVTQQNGAVTGGRLVVGGAMINGGTGVRLGVNSSISNLVDIQTFSFATASANNTRRNQQQSLQQFVQAAGRFDRDRDGRLDRKELTEVGTAVVAELRRRRGGKTLASAASSGPGGPSKSATPTKEKMVETFVTRCMTFDADKDDALNGAETTRMAAALIRSLS